MGNAKDRLAEKLKSMKKSKFVGRKKTTNDGMEAPQGKPGKNTPYVGVEARLKNKGGGGTVKVRNDKGGVVGVSTGGSYKSDGKDLMKSASAFAKIPLGEKTSLAVSGSPGKGEGKAQLTHNFGGGKIEKQKKKLKKMKQS